MRTAIIAALATAAAAYAGPLVPPVGPVTSTDKPLAEVEPRTAITGQTIITQPGSYYLTNNISITIGTAIIVSTDGDVTIDLNGFTIDGQGSADNGITTDSSSAQRTLTVTNGTIRDFTSDGIATQLGVDFRAQDVTSIGCLTGFRSLTVAHFHNCHAIGNTFDGFELNAATLDKCTARDNGGNGFDVARSATVENCRSDNNGLDGFELGLSSAIQNSVATANSSVGFALSSNCTIQNSTATENGTGFTLSFAGVVHNCAASFNLGDGFNFGPAGIITNSLANNNDGDGFTLGSDCRVAQCTADGNNETGAAGFRGSSDVTIDACTATDNTTGFVAGFGGLLIRCTAAGNGLNYDTANADHGPIIDRTAATGIISTTNPLANISY